jgi:mRNA-capping enzyme
LKWKPQDQSTIDFKLQIEIDSGPGKIPERIGKLYVLGSNPPFAFMKPKKSDLPYNGKIVECRMEVGLFLFDLKVVFSEWTMENYA